MPGDAASAGKAIADSVTSARLVPRRDGQRETEPHRVGPIRSLPMQELASPRTFPPTQVSSRPHRATRTNLALVAAGCGSLDSPGCGVRPADGTGRIERWKRWSVVDHLARNRRYVVCDAGRSHLLIWPGRGANSDSRTTSTERLEGRSNGPSVSFSSPCSFCWPTSFFGEAESGWAGPSSSACR